MNICINIKNIKKYLHKYKEVVYNVSKLINGK